MTSPNLAHIWAREYLSELKRLGVTSIAIAPGSRSTVLAIQALATFGENTVVHFDERGLGFLALGEAKYSGKPTCIITTSGTAVANLLPAVIEAKQSSTPMIVLSADRPPELRARSANQTIDQVKLFGNNVNDYFEIPCATEDIPTNTVRDLARHAWFKAFHPAVGPVHVNWMFREPFLTDPNKDEILAENVRDLGGDKITGSIVFGELSCDIRPLQEFLNGASRGLCVVGALASHLELDAVRKIVQKVGWPTLVDPLSQLRQSADLENVINFGDLALIGEIPMDLLPDRILHIGGKVTSKRISSYLAPAPNRAILTISSASERFNPNLGVSSWMYGTPHQIASQLREVNNANLPLLSELRRRSSCITELLNLELSDISQPITEPQTLQIISRIIPDESILFLGNSMPIRDFDIFSSPRKSPPVLFANRGASGIDGLVATAVGLSKSSNKRVTAVIGDLSALHDLSSLTLLRNLNRAFTLVIVNNDGGGIFSLLPVSGVSGFEQLFGTPHGIKLEPIVKALGLSFLQPKTGAELIDALQETTHPLVQVIEVVTNRAKNAEMHRDMNKLVLDSISQKHRNS